MPTTEHSALEIVLLGLVIAVSGFAILAEAVRAIEDRLVARRLARRLKQMSEQATINLKKVSQRIELLGVKDRIAEDLKRRGLVKKEES